MTFLEAVLNHPKFRANAYTTRFVDETPELFATRKRRDRATKLLTYIADVTVNGHPETKGRAKPPAQVRMPEPPVFASPGSAGVPPALSLPHGGEDGEGAGETPALPLGSVPNARFVPPGAKQRLDRIGPEKFAAWMRDQKRVLIPKPDSSHVNN